MLVQVFELFHQLLLREHGASRNVNPKYCTNVQTHYLLCFNLAKMKRYKLLKDHLFNCGFANIFSPFLLKEQRSDKSLVILHLNSVKTGTPLMVNLSQNFSKCLTFQE